MKREHILVGSALAVLVVAGLAAGLAPGAFATPDEPVREDRLSLREAPITPTNVTEDSATLAVTNWLSHGGGPSENVSVLVRAVDTETGMVETTTRTRVGTIDRGGDRAVPTRITVERSGGYRIQSLVFVDGERVASGTSKVSGVQALRPESARTGLRFHDFEGSLPTISFRIGTIADGTATLETRAYLTNGGDAVAEDLELIVRARQSDSNIVADRAVVTVSDVRSGRTTTPKVRLDVPDNYSYELDAILTRDDVIVDTESAVANLDPTDPVETNETADTEEFDAKPFGDSGTDPDGRRTTERGGDSGTGAGPGFGVAVALIAVVGAALLFGRRHP